MLTLEQARKFSRLRQFVLWHIFGFFCLLASVSSHRGAGRTPLPSQFLHEFSSAASMIDNRERTSVKSETSFKNRLG
jgi:hypothetical protein